MLFSKQLINAARTHFCSTFHLLLAGNMPPFSAWLFSPASTPIVLLLSEMLGWDSPLLVSCSRNRWEGRQKSLWVLLLLLMPAQDYHKINWPLMFCRSCSSQAAVRTLQSLWQISLPSADICITRQNSQCVLQGEDGRSGRLIWTIYS